MKNEFWLAGTDDGKSTRRDVLKDVEKQLGKKPKRLEGEIPRQCANIWAMYVDISNAGGFTIQSLESYARLRRKTISKFEMDLLLSIHAESLK